MCWIPSHDCSYSFDMCVCFAFLPFDKSHRLIGVSMVRQHAQPHLRDCAGLFWCTSCASPSSRSARLSWPGALQDPMRSQEVSPAPFPAVHSSSQLLAGTSMPLCREARHAARPTSRNCERTMLAVSLSASSVTCFSISGQPCIWANWKKL